MIRLVLVALAVLTVWGTTLHIASADIGQLKECAIAPVNRIDTGGLGGQMNSVNEEVAEVYIPTESFDLSAVKLNIRRYEASEPLSGHVELSVRNTGLDDTAITNPYAPSTTILGTDTVLLASLPVSNQPDTDNPLNQFECSQTENVEQIFTFDPPITLTAGTAYAFVLQLDADWSSNGGAVPMVWFHKYNTAAVDDDPTNGRFWENGPLDDEFVTTEWTPSYVNGYDDGDFALFSAPVEVTVTRDAYSWLDNFLTAIQMNSPVGKLIMGTGFALVLVIGLMVMRVPAIFALAFSLIVSSVLVTASLVSQTAFLAILSVAGLAVMAILFQVLTGSTDD